jgi:hypothetical protein
LQMMRSASGTVWCNNRLVAVGDHPARNWSFRAAFRLFFRP